MLITLHRNGKAVLVIWTALFTLCWCLKGWKGAISCIHTINMTNYVYFSWWKTEQEETTVKEPEHYIVEDLFRRALWVMVLPSLLILYVEIEYSSLVSFFSSLLWCLDFSVLKVGLTLLCLLNFLKFSWWKIFHFTVMYMENILLALYFCLQKSHQALLRAV